MPKKSANPEFTFEDAITELEEIVVSMEEDQLPLHALVDKFERGAKLHKECEIFLASAKKRLEIISSDTNDAAPESAPQLPRNDADEIRLF